MFAIIRIRNYPGINKGVGDTLVMMRLKQGNSCVLLPDTPEVKGMLQKTKDYVTWGEISKETLVKMLEKRLRSTGDKRVDAKSLKQVSGFDSFDALADAILDGKVRMHKMENLIATFRLTPPSKGFKEVNRTYPSGDLGHRGKEINGLIERMI